jgi:hypothetical protein
MQRLDDECLSGKKNNMRSILFGLMVLTMSTSCHKKKDNEPSLRYFEVGMKVINPVDWRDSSFVIATNDPQLLAKVEEELNKPVADRKIVTGGLLPGSAGYNRNADHVFNWHMEENTWTFAEVTIELIDGRPYSDVELYSAYWLGTVKRYGAWPSYLKKEIPKP